MSESTSKRTSSPLSKVSSVTPSIGLAVDGLDQRHRRLVGLRRLLGRLPGCPAGFPRPSWSSSAAWSSVLSLVVAAGEDDEEDDDDRDRDDRDSRLVLRWTASLAPFPVMRRGGCRAVGAAAVNSRWSLGSDRAWRRPAGEPERKRREPGERGGRGRCRPDQAPGAADDRPAPGAEQPREAVAAPLEPFDRGGADGAERDRRRQQQPGGRERGCELRRRRRRARRPRPTPARRTVATRARAIENGRSLVRSPRAAEAEGRQQQRRDRQRRRGGADQRQRLGEIAVGDRRGRAGDRVDGLVQDERRRQQDGGERRACPGASSGRSDDAVAAAHTQREPRSWPARSLGAPGRARRPPSAQLTPSSSFQLASKASSAAATTRSSSPPAASSSSSSSRPSAACSTSRPRWTEK